MEEKFKAIIDELVKQLGTKRREVLITLSTEEWLDFHKDVKFQTATGLTTRAIYGIGGNVASFNYQGITVHIKIDTDLK